MREDSVKFQHSINLNVSFASNHFYVFNISKNINGIFAFFNQIFTNKLPREKKNLMLNFS